MHGKIVAGKYRLGSALGSGGMAEVWSATNTFTERQVAIKFLNREVAKTPEAASRFLKEAKVSARINHPNVIDILDVGQTEDGQLFIVMELLQGFPLETALRRQTPPMTLYEFALVMIEVATALAAAHKAGVVHRDLKPTNIFLHKKDGSSSNEAVVKLLDFGVSKFLEEDSNHSLTIAGTVLGSPLYMSPEQARGDSNLDGRTDIFAFGAILFEALCGYRAYEAKNFNALIVKIATTKPKNIDQCAPHVPESIRRVVRACMAVDLKERAQSFDQVIAMLREAVPDLEAIASSLPSHGKDPEATTALPVLRMSPKPPAVAAAASSQRLHDTEPGLHPSIQGIASPAAVPAAAPTAPLPSPAPPAVTAWQHQPPTPSSPSQGSWTPNTSYASVSIPPPASTSKNAIWLTAIAGALVIGGIGIGAVVAARPKTADADAASSLTLANPPPKPTQAVTTTSAEQAPTPAKTDDTPTISVDALPGAAPKGKASAAEPAAAAAAAAASGPIAKGSGRLNVAASPGSCTITIDGKDRGTTPVAAIDLPAGTHQVQCKTGAKQRSATVTVTDGATSKYRFALDD